MAGIWVPAWLSPKLSKFSSLVSYGEAENPKRLSHTVSLSILGASLGKKLGKGTNSWLRSGAYGSVDQAWWEQRSPAQGERTESHFTACAFVHRTACVLGIHLEHKLVMGRWTLLLSGLVSHMSDQGCWSSRGIHVLCHWIAWVWTLGSCPLKAL